MRWFCMPLIFEHLTSDSRVGLSAENRVMDFMLRRVSLPCTAAEQLVFHELGRIVTAVKQMSLDSSLGFDRQVTIPVA